MDNNSSFSIRNSILLGIFKTIYLFLLNHNFVKSAETFKHECGLYDGNLETVPSKSLILRKCRCSKNQANQTEQKARAKSKNEWLEGTFEGGPFEARDEETHIFYVCDHCEQAIDKHTGIIISKANIANGTQKHYVCLWCTCKKCRWHCQSERRHEDEHLEIDKEKVSEHAASKSELMKLKNKFCELQGEHQKLIAVTGELTTALQTNIIGQTKNIYSVLEHCKSIYPSLFLSDSLENAVYETIENEEKTFRDVFNDNKRIENISGIEQTYNKENSRKEEAQFKKKSASPRVSPNIEPLVLENLSPRSPLKTPLTPETVRQILESVFERIFVIEKSRGKDHSSAPLKKDEVEKIVNEVLQDIVKTPSNFYGAGEGEVSRPGSIMETVIMRCSETFFDIDYEKLKRDLLYSDSEKKIRILQALRWRITKNDGPMREKVLESYITNDVLDLCSVESLPEKILLEYGTDHYVQESTCRLVNTLASLRQGRDYLTLDEKLLKKVLIRKVKDIKSVTSAVIRNMLVASVQKLSIRKQCRTQMVHEGLFEILLDYLDEFYEKLSRYCLEYCSALLMNLCLVEEAKERSTKNPRKVVGLLRKFLEGDNECCLPYVNGVMFSLLEKEEIVNEAKNQNLDKLLIRLIRVTNNENIRKQLDFIVQSRLFGKGDTNVSDTDEENREEVDLLEIELDQDDFITPLPSGEKLLEEYKTDKSPDCVSFSTMKRDPPNSAKSFSEETKQFYHKPSAEKGVFESTKPRRLTTCSQSLIKNYVKNKRQSHSCGRYPATPLCYMENCQRLQDGSGAQCSCTKCVPGQSRYSCGCYEAICREIDENDDQNNAEQYSSYREFGKMDAKNSQSPLPKFTCKKTSSKVNNNNDSGTTRTIQSETDTRGKYCDNNEHLPEIACEQTSESNKTTDCATVQSETKITEKHTENNEPLPIITHKQSSKTNTYNTDNATVTKQSETHFRERQKSENNEPLPGIVNYNQGSLNKGGRTGSGCKVCGERKCECAFDSRPKLSRTPTLYN